MVIGKRYKLKTPARAIEIMDSRLLAITIPAGGAIEVVAVSSDDNDMFVDVLLEGRTIAMHARDVNLHADEIAD